MTSVLTSERLRLRQMQLADFEFIAKLLADSEVMQHYPHVYDRDQAMSWLERQQRRYRHDGVGLWIVELAVSQQQIGQVGIVKQQIDDEWLYEIGYLIDRPFWRQGYAREAVEGCLRYAFETLKLPRICSMVRPQNIPSLRTAIAVGMRPRQLVDFHGFDHLLMGIENPL